MTDTIIENILDPKHRDTYRLSNRSEKTALCEELKWLEAEIMSQLDGEHKKLFRQYAEGWDKLHTELSIDTFASGLNYVKDDTTKQ